MAGHEAGDKFEVSVSPAEAYGERREGFTQRVPRKHFKNARLHPGMQVVLPTDAGPRAMTVLKVGMSVVDVREASAEELAHGHVHGDGGVAH
jgi:FKBP-type peptidyl-prolyl cis-trans isomerase SlyD